MPKSLGRIEILLYGTLGGQGVVRSRNQIAVFGTHYLAPPVAHISPVGLTPWSASRL